MIEFTCSDPKELLVLRSAVKRHLKTRDSDERRRLREGREADAWHNGRDVALCKIMLTRINRTLTRLEREKARREA